MNEPHTNNPNLSGAMTALITPFRSGEVDWTALDTLVDRQLAAKIEWLVVCGTTGEAPTLSQSEQEQIIQRVMARAGDQCHVMVGTGTNDTREVVCRTRLAAGMGADAVLVVTPYYNRPTQEGLCAHYASVADSVDIPIVIYDVPARTGVSIEFETVLELVGRCPNIVGIKQATGSVEGVAELAALREGRFSVLCGDDALTLPMMRRGARGVISVIGNLYPAWMKALTDAASHGEPQSADAWHAKVHEFASHLAAIGPNPLPIKTAMAHVGLIEEEFRLPLCSLNKNARKSVFELVERFELEGVTAA